MSFFSTKFALRCVFALLWLPLLPLTGCLYHTRAVQMVVRPNNVKTASLGDLISQINERDEAIHTLTMTVTITASVGGAHAGKVTDYTSLSGYILFEKPGRLRVLGLVPVLHNKAFDMASDGEKFKLLIPAKGKFIEGSDKVVQPSTNPLENLRPYIFIQALLVHGVPPADFSYVTAESHIDADPKKRRMVERLDYDLGVLHRRGDTNQLLPSRILHINREDLRTYQQDFYDANATIETEAFYSNYKDFGGMEFPATIRIRRPQEEYELTLTVEKVTENLKLGDDQFDLAMPAGMQVQQLP